ncbi:hypothetical protein [Segniliparus rugosus]|uniref:Scaffolding protein n=1 Tax=Segniliparus rugosus (strain ATCC BAA-974 / DSM 45345 / CCUG 50838 / CIP 108380 / JCM 13579 / CDC 945) TaxID=679197 RepID=E5XRT4_SEGRC|nr:hypothetical protein [Segniliparus rugosus]EFV12949.1 hypothetical protein HMPREF9336_02206 [Segniliparus rugosus ATCC BAA-974]
MSEQTTPTDNTDTVQAQEATPQVEQKPQTYSAKYVSDLRQEAANYRVQLRDAEASRRELEDQLAALASGKSQAEAASKAVQADFDRVVTAIQAGVPHDHVFAFAKTLQGSNAEEFAAHAEELKSMFGFSAAPAAATDRSQGLSSGSTSADPASMFAAFVNSQLAK